MNLKLREADAQDDLRIGTLRNRFASDESAVVELLERVHHNAAKAPPAIWIEPPDINRLRDQARMQRERKRQGAMLPLFGIPFSVKDNIDVAGFPTTAACPDFAYRPRRSATIVERLLDKGAICVGKTNMDQFATGLTGTRSPYGICASAYDGRYICGGSSSGSALSVAHGLASFSVATDSGGSGRIPAAYNNIVGWKPTIGLVSLDGIVPNSRTFDCPAVLANSVEDAVEVGAMITGFDAGDEWSLPRADDVTLSVHAVPESIRIAVPKLETMEWFGDRESVRCFERTLEKLAAARALITEIDFTLFVEAGKLILNGPWVAERIAGMPDFTRDHPQSFHPVVKAMYDRGERWSAEDLFRAMNRLQHARHEVSKVLQPFGALLVPTAAKPFLIDEVLADPIQKNIDVGTYSYFVNPLDLCAIAIPAGFRSDGLPFGITLAGTAWTDERIVSIASFLSKTLSDA